MQGARPAGVRIALAESCTGGMISAAISGVAGASDVFECGFVTYSNAAKISLLAVHEAELRRFGAVSQEVARQMAEGALNRSGADLALAVTGVAGPGASGAKPEGRVCFALARTGAETRAQTREFGAIGRAQVRAAATAHALQMLIEALR
ncbi:MAG: CinA family protein [Paracoccaceae bacterium]